MLTDCRSISWRLHLSWLRPDRSECTSLGSRLARAHRFRPAPKAFPLVVFPGPFTFHAPGFFCISASTGRFKSMNGSRTIADRGKGEGGARLYSVQHYRTEYCIITRRDAKQKAPTSLPYAVQRGPERAKCRADRVYGVSKLNSGESRAQPTGGWIMFLT